jgi:hypothetical protein
MCVSSLTHHYEFSDPVDSYTQYVHRSFNDIPLTAEVLNKVRGQFRSAKRRKRGEEEDAAYL